MADLDLCYTPASELARRIRDKTLSPVEIMRNCLDRIDAVNPTLNCFCFVFPDEALAEARAAEDMVMRGAPLGPLHGVPIAIKDFTPTKGKTTTMGSMIYKDWVPDEDAQIVTDLTGAGAIMVGKTATPEFAHAGFTHSPLWGVTRNPWNPERTPGGSSGGSAVGGVGLRAPRRGFHMGGGAPTRGILRRRPEAEPRPNPHDRAADRVRQHLALRPPGAHHRRCGTGCGAGTVRARHHVEPVAARHSRAGAVGRQGHAHRARLDLGIFAVDDEVAADVEACAAALRDAGATVEKIELGWTRECVDVWTDYWCIYPQLFMTAGGFDRGERGWPG